MKQHILYGKAGFKFKSKNTNSWLRPSNEMTEWSRCSLVCLFSIECNEYPTLQKWFFLTSWKPSISVTIHSDFGRINYVVRKSIFDHNYKNTSQPCLVNWQWIPWRIGVFKGDHLVSWCVRRFCHYDQAMVFLENKRMEWPRSWCFSAGTNQTFSRLFNHSSIVSSDSSVRFVFLCLVMNSHHCEQLHENDLKYFTKY